MKDNVSHWPNVRDKPGFLHRLMVELAGDAHISLEGDLSHCRFTDDLVVSRDQPPIPNRNAPSFVVLRLTPETVEPIFKQVMAAGLKRAIIHVEIKRNGVLELGAYDNFHRGCVVSGPGVSPELLEEMKKSNVLWDYAMIQNIRVILPYHLRTLAQVGAEVTLKVAGAITQRSVLDALEAHYPMLRGTIRDHVTGKRRPLLRFFACEEDVSHDSPDAPLPDAISSGAEPFFIIGAIAGG